MAAKAQADEIHRVVAAAVDAAFYRTVNPDLDAPGFDPIRHYLTDGWRQGRDPAPWFSVRGYLERNPDVARAGREPLSHYLTDGYREGREVVPSEAGARYLASRAQRRQSAAWSFEPPETAAPAAAEPAPVEAGPGELADLAAEFDAVYYAAVYPDVVASGVEPLFHFANAGWREGRDPSPRFSVRDYLEANPDVAAAGMNPLLHYVRGGRAEGRAPKNNLGFRYEILVRREPVADRVARAERLSAAFRTTAADRLTEKLGRSRTGLRDLHITFSHDDYTTNAGGVQLCLQREDARIAELGRDHLHVFPAAPWQVVRRAGESAPLGVLLNGEKLGVVSGRKLAEALGKALAKTPAGARSLAVHSLLGHRVDEVVAVAKAAGLTGGFFWLHDFASLCAGYHLLRDDVQDCAAPPPPSAACRICDYGPWRDRHLAEHERLFASLDLTVVSPSEPTLELWRRSWSFPHQKAVVLPHARLVERGPAAAPPERPLRIAFAGFPVGHKGWPIFRELAVRHADDPRYRFLHLGARPEPGVPVEFHEVLVTDAQPRAMQNAIESLEIDLAVVWPLCRETFSFLAYEAVAGGAAVVTGPDSGNVAAMVQAGGHGWVLDDEAALGEAVASGEIAALSRARRRPMLYDLAFSGLTVDLLREAHR